MCDYKVTRFFFTTAFHGEELVEWSNRAILLNQWRSLADKYSDLGVSIYEDDAKFLDLIETMVPVSTQSALFTFISMFAVAVLFISHPPTLFVATLSILSTSIEKSHPPFQIFAECMLLVVLIGMVHGLLIIPVIFNLLSVFPFRNTYQVSSRR
ncbi:hypothetical protein ANCDUO_14559 [Ancylostoma duodenale]|uniref:SSD domain-containing protein n=1 Tax=Ancylostoma duodenale TaxID=51022 RepID=A0A0C2CZR3_9BILA|nr:hypothetical protein ANCDUO_14559 [Ancylostoma duodenale]